LKLELKHENFNENILESKPSSMLDVGCGSGRYFEWAKKYGIDYSGVDVDAKQIKEANAKYKTKVFQHFDGQDLSRFKDKSVDIVLMIEVMEHIETTEALQKLLKECTRIARKYVLFTTPNCSDEKFLVSHRLIYHHYTHSVGKGFNFEFDNSHMHHLRFTKDSLSELLDDVADAYVVQERVPLDIRSTREPERILYFKLWGYIDCQASKTVKAGKKLKRLIKKVTKSKRR
jgi:ubiquinone/menaquinone biosynthesis C-methylase UbiE